MAKCEFAEAISLPYKDRRDTRAGIIVSGRGLSSCAILEQLGNSDLKALCLQDSNPAGCGLIAEPK